MVSMATGSVILLKNGTRPTNSIISQRLFILENKTWYQIKAKTLAFLPFIKYTNYNKVIINAKALRLLEPLLFTGRRVAKVLTKYIFKKSNHYVCFITSVPCLATLGTFVPG